MYALELAKKQIFVAIEKFSNFDKICIVLKNFDFRKKNFRLRSRPKYHFLLIRGRTSRICSHKFFKKFILGVRASRKSMNLDLRGKIHNIHSFRDSHVGDGYNYLERTDL